MKDVKKEKVAKLIKSYIDSHDDFIDSMEVFIEDVNDYLMKNYEYNGFLLEDDVVEVIKQFDNILNLKRLGLKQR